MNHDNGWTDFENKLVMDLGPRRDLIGGEFDFGCIHVKICEAYVVLKGSKITYPWDRYQLPCWVTQPLLDVPYHVAWRPEIMPIRWRNPIAQKQHDEEVEFGWTVPDEWYDLMENPPKALQDEFDKETLLRERFQYLQATNDPYISAEDEDDLSSYENTYELYHSGIYLSDEDEYDWIPVDSDRDSVTSSQLSKSTSTDSAYEALFRPDTTSDTSMHLQSPNEDGLKSDVGEDETESDIPVRILNTVLPTDNVRVSDVIAEHNLLMRRYRTHADSYSY